MKKSDVQKMTLDKKTFELQVFAYLGIFKFYVALKEREPQTDV